MKDKKQIILSIFVSNKSDMKSLKIIPFILIMMIVASCSVTKKVEKKITGKWSIVNIYEDSQKNNDDKLMKDLLESSYIEFKEDKTFEISIMGKKQTDKWSISEDGKKILSSQKNIFFEVLKFDESGMTLKSIKENKSVLLDLKKI